MALESRTKVVVAGIALTALAAVAVGLASRSRTRSGLEPIPDAPRIRLSRDGSEKLQVASATPQGPTQGEVRPSITFDRPVVPLATPEELRRLPPPATINPKVAGEWRWLGSSTVEFVPEKPLPLSTAFEVTVAANLVATDGAELPDDVKFTFETDRPRVAQYDMVPKPKWRWVERRQKFSITFSQPVDGLREGVELLADDRKVPVSVSKGFNVLQEEIETAKGDRRKYLESRVATDRRTRYEVTPTEDLPVGAAVRLGILDHVHGASGPLQVTGTRSWTFQVYGPMQVTAVGSCYQFPAPTEACPFGPVVLQTANTANVKDLRKLLTIEPPVEIDWGEVEGRAPNEWDFRSSPYLVIPGKFRPATRYTVKLAAGLPDEFGQAAPAWQGEFSTTDLSVGYELFTANQTPLQLLEADGDGAIPLKTTNIDELDLRFWKLGPAAAAALLLSEKPGVPSEAPHTEQFATRAGKNVVKVQPLSVRGLLGGAYAGLFFLEAGTTRTKRPTQTRVIGQLTNLAVHAKLGVTSGAVWVTRVSDGAPVEGAEVTLFDAGGSPTWHGTTDKDGIVQSAGLGAFAGARGEGWWGAGRVRRVVSATKGGDTGMVVASWENGAWPGAFGLDMDSSGGAPVDLGFLMAERGIYRPGEKVHLKGIVRYRAMGEIRTPPAGTRSTLTIVNARDATVLTKEVTLSRYGTFDAELDVGSEAPLGTWRASALTSLGSTALKIAGDFRVEAYRAPQFRVDVTAAATHLAGGDPVRAQVMARYLFGAALSDAPVKWNVVRKTLDFRPPRHDGFAFGVQTWWWDDDEPSPSGDVFASGRGKTDPLGAIAIEAGKAEASADRTWEYDVEVEVEDLSRQTVADRAQLVVHPASLYAGVRRSAGFASAGKPMDFELVAVTPAGQRKDAKVAVEVRRREWKWIKKKVAGDHWTTVSEPVEEPVGRCAASPGATSASCSVTPEKPGFHIVEATVQDDQGRKQVTRTAVYVIGEGWVAWQRDETDRIDLVPDKASYEVGETAHILVKSPYPVADALLSVEREGVLSARHVRLEGAATVLDIPVGEDAVPNVFVGLVLARGRVAGQAPTAEDDPGRPAVKTGYTQLKVERAGKRLAVQVTPNATEYRPRDTVKLDLTVKNAKGQGVPAELTVWAVDEGVLRLTGYKLPDLVDAIHPPRGLAVRQGEALLGLVKRKVYSEKGSSAGGGGGGPEGAAMRSRFRTTPLFAPSVQADADGRAHVEFQLPDNLTSFRIMAIAVTEGDLVGGGQANIAVARPLIALPALPRAARVGDRFEAGVVVHSPGGRVDAVDVSADVKGLRLDGPATQHVVLGGKPKEVRFKFVAEQAGQAVLRFQVRGGQEQDGVEQKFPVTLPVAMVTTALQGETDATGHEKVILPKDVRTDTGGVEITMASTALGGFAEGMTQLVDYPYGCLEQLSSRLVPFVALRELASQGMVAKAEWLLPPASPSLPGAIVDSSPDEVVRKTVKAIESRQQPDGSYRFWEGSPCQDPWSSAYALWSLGRADKAGFPVDRAALKRAQDWLADSVLAGRTLQCGGYSWTPNVATRVFALFALTRTGLPKSSYHADLHAHRSELPLFSKAMLADALARGGDGLRAGGLLEEVLRTAKVTTAEVHLEEGNRPAWEAPWSSDARSTAMALQAMLAIRPDHPFVSRMVTYLSRARRSDGRFRNTQEAAYTLTALSDLVRIREAQTPAFTANVSLGGKQVASQEFKGRSLDVKKVKIPMAALLQGQAPSVTLPFEFQRSGKAGTLYYGTVLRAAPTAPPRDSEERGLYVQRWLEPWQGGGQVRAAKAGEVLRLRVRISTPQQRNYVVVEIPLPSGLEAVDTTLASSAKLPGPAKKGSGTSDEPAAWFWSPFNHTELRDDRVLLFADNLPAGLHTYSLAVRATTPGEFLLAPAHGEEMYSPEVYGRSEGGVFKIAPPESAGR